MDQTDRAIIECLQQDGRLPYTDIAARIGVSEGTVKSRCARGRARLLPGLAHLRGSAAVTQAAGIGGFPPAAGLPGLPGPAGRNRAAAGDVSPPEGGGESP